MKKPLLKIQNLDKHFDGIAALDGFSCTLQPKEIVGLIGPNGAGKTTLFNVLTGFTACDSGKAEFNGRTITGKAPHKIVKYGIARTFQDLRLIRQMSVLDNVLLCFQNQKGEKLRHVFFNAKGTFDGEKANEKKAFELLDHAGLSRKMMDTAGSLSYGQQKLLSMVCCLAVDADLILLDEPVAGINPQMIVKILTLIGELPTQGKAVMLIEHNMDVVMRICERVIFMDTGRKVSEGTPDEVRNDPRVIEAYLE